MLTVTLPTQQMCAQMDRIPRDVRVVPWDLTNISPVADDINAVLLPNYFDDNVGFVRLSDLRNLNFVQLPSAGFERTMPRLPDNVVVANGRGIHDDEVAEFAVGLILASVRGIGMAVRDMSDKQWRSVFRPSLADRKVLLVGYGSIGKAIARRLLPFGVDITAVAHAARDDGEVYVREMVDLPSLLPSAEIVILSVPLNDDTRHLVDATFLRSMPFGAHLINVARGGVVDTDALVAELTSGRIFAAVDVTDPEPLPADHPLWLCGNLILTPHIAGKTTATESRTLELYRRQILALLEGRALENVISL